MAPTADPTSRLHLTATLLPVPRPRFVADPPVGDVDTRGRTTPTLPAHRQPAPRPHPIRSNIGPGRVTAPIFPPPLTDARNCVAAAHPTRDVTRGRDHQRLPPRPIPAM